MYIRRRSSLLCIRKSKLEMHGTIDYLFLSNPSDMDGMEDVPSTPEPNLSDPCSPRLSDAVYFLNSSDIVCISSDKSTVHPLPKKKFANFSVSTNQSQVVQKSSDSYCRCTAASRPARAQPEPKDN